MTALQVHPWIASFFPAFFPLVWLWPVGGWCVSFAPHSGTSPSILGNCKRPLPRWAHANPHPDSLEWILAFENLFRAASDAVQGLEWAHGLGLFQ